MMALGALTKLLFLVILAFILCLPEFFTLDRASSVSLHCVGPRLCGEECAAEAGAVRSNDTCPEQGERLLRAAADQRNVTQTDSTCFVCQANVNMRELDVGGSSSAEVVFEFAFALRPNSTASVRLAALGRDRGSQYLQLSDRRQGREGRTSALLHCPPSLDGADRGGCHLLLSNRTFAGGGLPWKRTAEGEWKCVLRAVWLALLCVVLLLIVITVARQILEGKKKSSAQLKKHNGYTTKGQHVVDTSKRTEVNTPMVLSRGACGLYFWPALSSIEEVETADETDTELFFSDNMDNNPNGNINHRNSRLPSARRTGPSVAATDPS